MGARHASYRHTSSVLTRLPYPNNLSMPTSSGSSHAKLFTPNLTASCSLPFGLLNGVPLVKTGGISRAYFLGSLFHGNLQLHAVLRKFDQEGNIALQCIRIESGFSKSAHEEPR